MQHEKYTMKSKMILFDICMERLVEPPVDDIITQNYIFKIELYNVVIF